MATERRRVLGLLLGALLWAACTEYRDALVDIDLKLGCAPDLEDLKSEVTRFCLSLEDEAGSEVGPPSCAAEIADLALRADESENPLVVVFEGFRESTLAYRGRSAPVQLISSRDTRIAIPIAPADRFGLLFSDEAGCTPLPLPLADHTATLFSSGHLLLAGTSRTDPTGTSETVAVLYDSRADRLAPLGGPAKLRTGSMLAVLLEDGRVFFGGGTQSGQAQDAVVILRGTEPLLLAYDPACDYTAQLEFDLLVRTLVHPRARPSSEVLFGGQVVVADGSNPAEMFLSEFETSDALSIISGGGPGEPFPTKGLVTTAVAFREDVALLMGGQANRLGRLTVAEGKRQAVYKGYDAQGVPAWDAPRGVRLPTSPVDRILFLAHSRTQVSPFGLVVDPAKLDVQDSLPFKTLSLPATSPTRGYTATRLPDGCVIAVGGETREGAAAGCFKLAEEDGVWRWAAGPALNIPRRDHTASLLPDGRLVVVGGTRAGASSVDPALTAEVISF